MKRSSPWIVLVMCVACLQIAACGQVPAVTATQGKPATVEHLDGAEPSRVTLSDGTAERLDIQTAPVSNTTVGGTQRKFIPYSAVIYDAEGNTWTYINPSPQTFVRHPITVDRIQGDLAILSEGPDLGTMVVAVGAEELYGSESEFEEE